MNRYYDLRLVLNECKNELTNIGIEYGYIDSISVNTRALKRWGQCHKVCSGHYTINISKFLLDTRNGITPLKETIMHELLHSVDGCMNHGTKWNALAKKVNVAYGYHITRCSSADDKGIDETVKSELNKAKATKAENRITYRLKCVKCEHIWARHKMSDLVKHPNLYRCKCGGEIMRI